MPEKLKKKFLFISGKRPQSNANLNGGEDEEGAGRRDRHTPSDADGGATGGSSNGRASSGGGGGGGVGGGTSWDQLLPRIVSQTRMQDEASDAEVSGIGGRRGSAATPVLLVTNTAGEFGFCMRCGSLKSVCV